MQSYGDEIRGMMQEASQRKPGDAFDDDLTF
jgi:hypothetical protein